MNLVMAYMNETTHHAGDVSDEEVSSHEFNPNTNYRERAFSWDRECPTLFLPFYSLSSLPLVAFENQINSMEGNANYDNLFVFPRNRSESISALSDIIRGVRSDSFADSFRGRSDSLSESILFPLLIESATTVETPMIKIDATEVRTEPPRLTTDLRYTLQTPMIEVFSTETRVGAYSREERQIRINRFRDKKKKRVWRKQIKYDCRKRLADTRPRIKGRFVSRKEDGTEGGDDEIRDYISVLNDK